MPLAPGTLLHNRYRVVSILGQGGMGAVYRATDEHLHIPVAVKENLFLTEEYGRQFQREAHILAGLRHVNLPHVTDYFSMENQVQYLVMDYIEGEDLRQRMERMGALPEREAVLIGISICDALTYLHTRHPPIVHRDIKPGNIKVTADGQAVLVDFGLAKVMQGSQITSTGARAMTPGYSPPEQYGTARTDPRSDIYSLGATLYASLTGIIPEDSLGRITGKTELTPLRDLAPKVNRKLAEAIERALEIDPGDRYQEAEEFKHTLIEVGELVSYFQDRPTIAPPPTILIENTELNEILKEDPEESEVFRRRERSRRRRQKNRMGWVLVPVIAALFSTAYLISMLRPDLTGQAMSFLSNAPTFAQETTDVASLNTTITPVLPGLPSLTPALIETSSLVEIVEEPEATPIPETTATISPTNTATIIPTLTPQGGGQGQIAFASDKAGVMQIWLLDVADPRNQRQITDRKDGACQPTWSPDGMNIAFISPCTKKQDTYPGANIYRMQVDALGSPDRSSLTQLTSSLEGDYDPTWSPDGKRIAFTSLRNGKSSIWLLNLDDNSLLEMSNSRYPDKHPAWNPKSMQLAFVRQAPYSQIWYMTDNGRPQNQFTFSGAVNNLWPAWSMDGEVVFYSQTDATPSNAVPILAYQRYEDRYNKQESRIPAKPTGDFGPVAEVDPSPDGFWLAYESWPDGNNHDIFMMSINGSNQNRLTTDPAYDFGPVWRPVVPAQ
jgi:eukaryotic-like serine/threonine-protein kinase